MRILEREGSRFIPAFNAAGERMTDFDLSVALGARFDPRWTHPGPRQITVQAPMRVQPLAYVADPTEIIDQSKWVFDFEPREVDGEHVLTVTMSAFGDATPFDEMPNNEQWGTFFFDLTRTYANLCKS